MKRRSLLLALSIYAVNSYAQVPEDALRMSWNTQGGTARSQAIGGAMGALGGDISTVFDNPAGLAFYKSNEFVVSPGAHFLSNKGDFRGTSLKGPDVTKFTLGTSGLVFAFSDPYSNWSNKAISFAINRTADFNGVVHYKGLNDLSSYSEQFLEEAKYNGLDENSVYDYPFTSGLAFYTYLIDTIQNADGSFGGFKSQASLGTGLNQERTITTSGGITELAFAFATNKNDKVYLGGTLGIPIMNYARTTVFRESDATTNTQNYFNYSEFTQLYSSKGAGVNLKLGLIFKPTESLRIGAGIHTPTFYGLSERGSSSMTTDTENYGVAGGGVVTANQDSLNYYQDAYFKYNLSNPWKFLLSGAFMFGQQADVTQQKGFISADLEYITYGGSRFSSSQSDGTDDDDYYKGVNSSIKQSYKGAFNLRVGGELKFNTLMARAGFAYYGNPYKDAELNASRTSVSGGLGYRNKGMFVDLSYTYQLNKDVNFPYRLADVANTFATITGTGGTALLTVGFKF